MILPSTSYTLELVLSSSVTTNQLQYTTSYVDHTTTAFTPASSDGVTNDTTPVTIVSAPAASTQRQVKFISVWNTDTVSATITVQINNSSNTRKVYTTLLLPSEHLTYTDTTGFKVHNISGYEYHTVTTGTSAHGALAGLTSDDHPQYVTTGTNRTITGIHTFSPNAPNVPFVVSANGTGLVTNLNADRVDGLHSTDLALSNSPYLTYSSDSWLTNERVLTGGTGILTRHSGSFLFIDFTGSTTPGSQTLSGLTDVVIGTPNSGDVIKYDSFQGKWVNSANTGASGGAPVDGKYLVTTLDSTLTNERAITAGTGIYFTDGGANSQFRIHFNTGIFTGVNHSVFGGLTTDDHSQYLFNNPSTSTRNQLNLTNDVTGISIYAAGTQTVNLQTWVNNYTDPTTTGYVSANGKIFGYGLDSQQQLITNVATPVSSTDATTKGYVDVVSGNLVNKLAPNTGTYLVLSGSNQLTVERILTAGTNITFSDAGPGGAFTINSTATGGGGGAPTTGLYLTLALDGNLSAERVISQGTGIVLIDGGANSTLTVGFDTGILAGYTGSPVTGHYLVLAGNSFMTNERVATAGTGISLIDAGSNSTFTIGFNTGIFTGAEALLIRLPSYTGRNTMFHTGIYEAIKIVATGQDKVQRWLNTSALTTGEAYIDGNTIFSAPGIDAQSRLVTRIATPVNTGDAANKAYVDTLSTGLYLTLSLDNALSNERVLAAGTGVSLIDGGANSTLTVGFNTGILAGYTGSPVTGHYLVLASDNFMTNERVITAGTGISIIDAGAGSTVTVGFNTGILANYTGAPLTGTYLMLTGLGQLTNERTIAAGPGIYFTDLGPNSSFIVNASGSAGGAPTTGLYLTLAADGNLSAERVLTAGTGVVLTDNGANSSLNVHFNTGMFLTVQHGLISGLANDDHLQYLITTPSDSTRNVISLTNDATAISIKASVTQSLDLISVADNNIVPAPIFKVNKDCKVFGEGFSSNYKNINLVGTGTVSTDAANLGYVNVVSGALAPKTGTYLVLTGSNDLTVERILTAGTNITFSDAGPGGAFTINAGGAGGAPSSGLYVTLAADGNLSNERVITAGTGISLIDAGANSSITVGFNTGILSNYTGSPVTGHYLVMASNDFMTNERVITPGTGISIIDGGVGTTATIGINTGYLDTVYTRTGASSGGGLTHQQIMSRVFLG